MAIQGRLAGFLILCSTHLYITIFAVILKTTNNTPWANEFDSIELSCLIESISSNNPRIEWKKIKNGESSHVYFDKRILGDLEHRAQIREPASLVIINATRSDTAQYRCEVTATNDYKSFDEIVINLSVRVKPVVPRCSVPRSVPVGHSAELRCVENEGFPQPRFQWFRNNEEMPEDPKSNPKFLNSSYTLNVDTGTLKFSMVRKEDTGEYHCVANNDAGNSQCSSLAMEVYDINLAGIILGALVVTTLLFCATAGIRSAYKRGYLTCKKQSGSNYRGPVKEGGLDYVLTEDEGDFRHKSSFFI